MKIIFVLIIIIVSVCFYIVGYMHAKSTNDDFQRKNGNLDARLQITEKLAPIFGRMQQDDYKDAIKIYDIKATSVYAVKRNDVMTIKIAE